MITYFIGIIATLFAVAIPTFTTQKSAAQATAAMANIKAIEIAVETCAADNTDGTYRGCLTGPAVTSADGAGALVDLVIASTTPRPGEYQVVPIGNDGMAYLVQAAIEVPSGDAFYFAELSANGELGKTCGPAPFGPEAYIRDADANGPRCGGGTWTVSD
jgi:type II secretory pathway pseudopilin PulG